MSGPDSHNYTGSRMWVRIGPSTDHARCRKLSQLPTLHDYRVVRRIQLGSRQRNLIGNRHRGRNDAGRSPYIEGLKKKKKIHNTKPGGSHCTKYSPVIPRTWVAIRATMTQQTAGASEQTPLLGDRDAALEAAPALAAAPDTTTEEVQRPSKATIWAVLPTLLLGKCKAFSR